MVYVVLKREDWREKLADELYTGARKTFPRRRVISKGIDDV